MNQDTTTRAALIALDAIEDGGLAEVEGTVDGDSESIILHRDGGQVRGWFNVCPHAGRRLDWAPGESTSIPGGA